MKKEHKSKGRKWIRRIIWITGMIFLFMNVIAFIHAYKFTHFTNENVTRTFLLHGDHPLSKNWFIREGKTWKLFEPIQ